MTSAQSLKKSVEQYFDNKGIKYAQFGDDDSSLLIRFKGDHYGIGLLIGFDPNTIGVSAHKFGKCASSMSEVYSILNGLNASYKWPKFYVDEDNSLCADYYLITDCSDAGESCLELAMRISQVVENALVENPHALQYDRGTDNMFTMAFVRVKL